MPTDKPLVSIVIASYNMNHLIGATLNSCMWQDYANKEVIVYDDCSTDGTENRKWGLTKYYRGEKNVGVGNAFNAGIEKANGEIVIILCADDLFLDKRYISDVVNCFTRDKSVGHVTRYYFQFIDGGKVKPCRAWRDRNPIVLSNNPSGLAFRKKALEGLGCSNKMFIETSYLTSQVLKNWNYVILPYDAIGARVHQSTSTTPDYWLKRRVSSPVLDWHEIGGVEIARDYVSFIQIKNGFTMDAVFEEIGNFIKLRPLNIINPAFWFWAVVAILTPRKILRKLPAFYRKHIGVRITREVKRS